MSENMHRHPCGGTALQESTKEDGDYICMEVIDDGIGFTRKESKRTFGLQTMRERASSVDGTLEVHSSPGRRYNHYLSVALLAAGTNPETQCCPLHESTRRKLVEQLFAGIRMNLREWALPVYTILMQLAVGALFSLWVIRALSSAKYGERKAGPDHDRACPDHLFYDDRGNDRFAFSFE